MRIEPAKKKVSELLPITGSIRYDIPCFQRQYSWNEEQIRQLFDDIRNEEQGYYAGNVLVICEGDDFSVIDGQQRLTTISLFLLALSELFGEYSTVDEVAIGNKLDIKRQLFLDVEKMTPRINLLEKDAIIYSDLLRLALGKQPKGKWGNRRIAQRYRFIKRTISDELSDFAAINQFYKKLMEVTLLRIDVPGITDAFMVFSSLNSKGQPLTLVDLLKGEFIGRATSSGHSEGKVLDSWNELVETLSFGEDELSERYATQFLLNNLDAFESDSGNSATKSKALSQYQIILGERYSQGEDYLGTLVNRAKIFSQIVKPSISEDLDPRLQKRLVKLEKLESTQAIPLLLFVMHRAQDINVDIDCLIQMLDGLIDFYVRRNIVLVPKSSNIRARLLSIVRQIRKEKLKGWDVVWRVLEALEVLSATDEQFRIALEQPIYDKSSSTTRFVLIDIERRIGKCPSFDKGHPDTLDECVVTGSGKKRLPRWSIEHILPEGKLPQCWIDDIASGNPVEAKRIQDECVHLLGNLTLTPYNAELAQKPFYSAQDGETGSKRDFKDKSNGRYVGLRIGLFLNESIPDTEAGESLKTKQKWGIEDIKRRNLFLSEKILELYPLPGSRLQDY